jgi:hypothetical protein
MRFAGVIAIALGLSIFGLVVLLGVLTVNNPSPFWVALFGLSIAALVPTAFALCRFAAGSGDDERRFFSGGHRTHLFDIVTMLLAICLTAATVNVQHPSRLLCGGRLSAGFPAPLICDASGESPLSSVGKIDWADLDSINLPGAFADILLYMSVLSVVRLAVSRLSAPARRPMG